MLYCTALYMLYRTAHYMLYCTAHYMLYCTALPFESSQPLLIAPTF
jgi:hypothetical protein